MNMRRFRTIGNLRIAAIVLALLLWAAIIFFAPLIASGIIQSILN